MADSKIAGTAVPVRDEARGTHNPSDARHPHPVTERLLRWNASLAAVMFGATAVLAVAGNEQAAYVALLGGAGFSSLAATMSFRLVRLR